MNRLIRYKPVFPFVIALMAGIAAGDRFPGHQAYFIFFALVSAAIMLRAVIGNKEIFLAPLFLFVSMGYLSIQPWAAPILPENHVTEFEKPFKWKIFGVVENDPITTRENRSVFVVRVKSLQHNADVLPACGRLRVTCAGDLLPEIETGDMVTFPGKIKKTRNFQNPGGFDYERYMAYRGILASSYAPSKNLTILQKGKVTGFARRVEDIRMKISGKIDQAGIEHSSAAILKALVIGDRSGIEEPLRNAFNRAGMGHLLAISGLHVGIVASFFYLFFSRLLALSRTVLDRAWVFKGAALLCLGPVVFYGLIAGMSPSTQRAVIMAVVFLSAFLIDRENDPLNTLAVAALVILIAHPPSLFSISFQLSFTAVSAILLGFASISNLRNGHGGKTSLKEKLAGFFLVSLFAILGTLPLVMYYFNQISLIGPAANFVLVPLVGFVAVPAGLILAFFLPLNETVAGLGFQFAGNVLSLAIYVLRFFSDLPFSAVKTVTPSFPEIAMYYICASFLLFWSSRKKPAAIGDAIQNSNSPLASKGRRNYVLPCTLALLAAAATDIAYWTYTRFFQDDLSITVLDVGQGNAAIVEFTGGKTILIDGGGFYDNDIFDVGRRIVAPLLWRKKIMTVDSLFLTHPNSDHLNGLLYIAKHFNVKSAMTNNQPAQTRGYMEFLKIVREEKIDLLPFSNVLSEHDFDGAKVKVLYPPPDFMDKSKTESWRDENSNSLVIRIQTGGFSCLFTGDITSESEAELVSMYGNALKSNLLIAPHHGSSTSSSMPFLQAVNPDTVVISVGWRNRFKLPDPEVLKRYENIGAKIYRTDLNGAVQIRSDGRFTEIEPWVE